MWATPGVSLFHAGCLCAAVSVLSVESRPHWRGLQRSFRVLSDQREGAERHWTTPFERRADRGSDSAFQMADITRRILARGSTSTPVCETADCFLFHSLSLSLSAPLPVFFLPQPLPLSPSSNSKQKTQLSTQRWTAWLILGFFLFFIISIFWISILHQAYLLSFTLSFSWPNIFPLSPSPNVLAHSFPFKKNAASIWLWSSFTFLFLPS